MKDFFKNKRNVAIFSVVVAILIIIAGVIVAVNMNKKKAEKLKLSNQKAVVADNSKAKVLGSEKEQKEEEQKECKEKYTEQYKKYEELSEEEKKKKEVVPKKYEVNYQEIENIIDDQKEEKKKKEDLTVPKKYNLAERIKIKTEDQGDYGLCWDFAATKSLETNIELTQKKKYDFSEMHVNYVTSNLLIGSRDIDDGGNFSIYEDYLVDSGAVLEKDVGYKDYSEDVYKKFLDMKNIVTVTKTVNFPTIQKLGNYEEKFSTKDIETVRNAVKTHIMNYGTVYAEVSMEKYDTNTNTLYSSPDEFYFIDHAISIVGWDDNYSKDNFPEDNRPKKDGAYLALNSWGESFGDNGYFYISYEDQNVEYAMSGIVSTSYKDAYKISSISNSVIKDIIMQRLSNTIKEYEGSEYVTDLALSRIGYINLQNTYIENLKGIELFKNLYYLDLGKTDIADIRPLKDLKQLEYVNLSNTKVKDVSSLKDLELYVLDISNNENIKGYEQIKKLKMLNVANCDITDISKINELEELESLDLSENTEIKNLDKLNNNLSEINLSDCNIKNLNDVSHLTNLASIVLANNNLDNINGIEKLNNLYYIDLSGNKIKDYSKIAKINGDANQEDIIFGETRTLVVQDAGIKDISIFNSLSNITSLYLANNEITDLSGFYNNNIYELDLSGNGNLNNVQYLRNLENLFALYLEECNIEDLSEISKLENIGVLDLAKNNITTVNKLNNLHLMALSLEENIGIEGKIDIGELEVLNIANIDYDSQKLKLGDCEYLSEINLSGSKDEEIKKTLENNKLEEIAAIVLDGTIISKDTFGVLAEKGIYIVGGDININQYEDDNLKLENSILDLSESSELKKAIKSSVQFRFLYITGGKLNRNLNSITINPDTSRISLTFERAYMIEDLKIIIELKPKADENNNIINKTATSPIEDENNTTENKIEEEAKGNKVVNETTKKDKDYKMVDD